MTPKPKSIIAQVAGSGTADVSADVTVMRKPWKPSSSWAALLAPPWVVIELRKVPVGAVKAGKTSNMRIRPVLSRGLRKGGRWKKNGLSSGVKPAPPIVIE